jgi:molybdopterin/thiamine biosynthesis adenylyltransferase
VLQEEVADLERLAGQPAKLNEELLNSAAVRQYNLPYRHEGAVYDLTVTYSDFHPYFRVEVSAAQRFRNHQHPFEGNLCLIRGGTWNWNVDETAAQLIESQMPMLLRDNGLFADEGDATRPSEPSAVVDGHVEPYVGYYTYEPRTAVRVDGSWPDLAEVDHGTLVLGLDQPTDPRALRATVLEIRGEDGTTVRRADPTILAGYPNRIIARWCRVPYRPAADGPDAVLAAAVASVPALSKSSREAVDAQHELDITGVVFTDGLRPGADGDAWMFVVRGVGGRPPQRASKARKQHGGRVAPPREQIGPYLARAYRAGRRDVTERARSLSALADKKVVVFGAGGIGAPSAIEFAKAGIGTLVVVEFDAIDPGNAPRWILGYQATGIHKLEGINQLVRWNWPYTTLELRHFRLGTARSSGAGEPEWTILAETLQGADLIYDATAEVGVNYFLAEVAKERGIPYLTASTTEGGWGGRVARFRPGKDDACWTCLTHHEADDPEMIPPADPDPSTRSVWPAGCTDPTFTGTGFDVATVSLAGVRLAASTLCEGDTEGYPPAHWDVAVYEFRDAAVTLPGTARTYLLSQHADCEPCRIRRCG